MRIKITFGNETDVVNKYLGDNYEVIDYNQHAVKKTIPRIVCNDGFSMSVQASEFHYCSPRNNYGPYSSVEVGFPSEHEELLEEYKESTCAEQVESVFPYVPIEVVINIIQNHGGIK